MVDDLREDVDLEEEQEAGTTRMLTSDGWEDCLYTEPDDTWRLLEDGSWVSPDGLTRTWPLMGPDYRS
jgi:hypothetical protein